MLGKVHSPRRNLYGPVYVYIIYYFYRVVNSIILFFPLVSLIFEKIVV